MRLAETRLLKVVAAAAATLCALPAHAWKASYEHSLSSVTGVVPFAAVRLVADPRHQVIFVVGEGQVRIFNQAGMETFSFGGADAEFGVPTDVAALEDGDLIVLTYAAGTSSLVRCNYRGEPIARITPSGAPAAFSKGFLPGAIAQAGGRIYLADKGAMKVLVLDDQGGYVASFDLAERLDVADKRGDYGLRGFNVDADGTILFTIQSLFSGYVLSPDGTLRRFGVKGSARGKFNVVGGIARDDRGFVYVTDILKSAVLVFDPELRFVEEFGYRTSKRGSGLVAPVEVVTSGGRVYVAQNARRGVSVFRVSTEAN